MGNQLSNLAATESIIGSLIGGLGSDQLIFTDSFDGVDYDEMETQRYVQCAIACFREGRQYYEASVYEAAKDKFNEAIFTLMQATLHSQRGSMVVRYLSATDIVSFVDKRCICLQYAKQQGRCRVSLKTLEECECFENDEDYQVLIDALLVVLLTCLADTLEFLGQLKEGEMLHSARGRLQHVLYGDSSLKYSISSKNLCACGCAKEPCLSLDVTCFPEPILVMDLDQNEEEEEGVHQLDFLDFANMLD